MEKFQTDVFNSTDSDLKSSLAHPLNVQECESVAMVETAKDRHGNDVSKKHFEIYFQAAKFLLPKQLEQMVVSKIQANGPNQKKALVTRVIDLFTDRVHLAKLLKSTNPAYMPLKCRRLLMS